MLSIKTIDNLTKDAIEKAISDYKKLKREAKKKKNTNASFTFNYMVSTNLNKFVTNNFDPKSYTARYLLFYFYDEDDKRSQEFINKFGKKVNNYLDSINLYTIYNLDTLNSWGEIKGKEVLRRNFIEFDGDSTINRFSKLKEIGDSYGVDSNRYPALLVYDIENKNQAIKYYGQKTSSEIYLDVKEIIANINENYGELDLRSIGTVSSNSDISNIKEDFLDLYEKYTKKTRGIKSKIAEVFELNYTTLYRRILSANLYTLFTRDEIMMMALMFKLDRVKANEFLKSYNLSKLEDDDPRDHIIINGIDADYDIKEINKLLDDQGLEELRADKKKAIYSD